jgi:hypothetical protein
LNAVLDGQSLDTAYGMMEWYLNVNHSKLCFFCWRDNHLTDNLNSEAWSAIGIWWKCWLWKLSPGEIVRPSPAESLLLSLGLAQAFVFNSQVTSNHIKRLAGRADLWAPDREYWPVCRYHRPLSISEISVITDWPQPNWKQSRTSVQSTDEWSIRKTMDSAISKFKNL